MKLARSLVGTKKNGCVYDEGASGSYNINTARVITRASDNKMVWRWDNTDPFGMIGPNENPSSLGTFTYNPRFPGQVFDKETNLHYNWYRYYDPQLGSYIQSDPIGLDAGQFSTYAYVNGNPVGNIDPAGLADIKLGQGYTGRVDPVPNSDVWEIHVFDPKGQEIGLYNQNEWFNKHGKKGRPEGIPDSVEQKIRGEALEQMRKRGLAPQKGRANIKGIPLCKIPGIKALGALQWLGTGSDIYDMVNKFNEQNKIDEENAKECGAKPGNECL